MQDKVIKRLTIRVPGSSANLGPGFDTLALAYKLYCKIEFCLLDKASSRTPLIAMKGKSDKAGDVTKSTLNITDDFHSKENNLVYKTLSKFLAHEPELLNSVSINIESDIPPARGLGSSAALIIGAAWAAYALCDKPIENNQLIKQALAIEGHADNLTASLLGGLTVVACDEGQITTQKMMWPSKWCTIVCLPDRMLSTQKARSVLPKRLNYVDAVYNIQRVALLLAAVRNEDEELLKIALQDRLHEQYRSCLIPELMQLRKQVDKLPALGCVLSGAGPSVLIIVKDKHKQEVLINLRNWAKQQTQQLEFLDLVVDETGLQASYE